MREIWISIALLALGCTGTVEPVRVTHNDVATEDAGAEDAGSAYCLHVAFVPTACDQCVTTSCEAESTACTNDDWCVGEFECEDDCNLDPGCVAKCRKSYDNERALALHQCAANNCSACDGPGMTYAVVPCAR